MPEVPNPAPRETLQECRKSFPNQLTPFSKLPFLFAQQFMVPMKKLKSFTMIRCVHLFFGLLEFPIEKVKGDPIMFPALPHHGESMIGAIVAAHGIRDMVKK